MGRLPCCDEMNVKKGPWTSEEDEKLVEYIQKHGSGSWRNLPKGAGLRRCGKSCRLRWTNYLRPDIKRGRFSEEEERLIIHLHSVLGNKWSMMAARLPGRTDNEIKNYWNTHLKKKLVLMGIDPVTHRRRTDLDVLMNCLPNILAAAAGKTATGNIGNLTNNPLDNAIRLQADAANSLARFQMLQTLIQTMSFTSPLSLPHYPDMDALKLLASFSPLNDQLDLHQREGLINGSLVLGQDQMQALNLPALSNYTSIPRPDHSQQQAVVSNVNDVPLQELALQYPSSSGAANTVETYRSGTCTMAAAALSSSVAVQSSQSTPSLMSTSSENLGVDYVEELSNSNSSSPFATYWQGSSLQGLDDDFSWKDMFDQISWSNEFYSNMGANLGSEPRS